ncbi:YdbL family protein [Pseudoalteromonas sp. SR44-5]|uniref:YdbL family protein n=1 Tax=Pseudoalteromonas rhizosphaerae TaxID=2518973 RepID=A0ABW8L4M7_9GAMM|nr:MULTISPECIES: YdbL family protein [Pseudoalteromonas]MBB1333694.1 YdbL family protein [Pseudoalteromonas sp. SR41-6]MBB1341751.1 YdbL family protein [Pseudoalteromonas sp. SR45-6]MBB1367066.1 YdbL family protein [Pseudoalteromonas sp. SR44-5]MBB1418204.1 YdbL family protein [Pseudoalteromonas sp. SG44-1]MBB1422493.1 YdbL family protein [Pseudoalteromonas sp. SG43-7]|tara:strand:+ start:2403 stop:2738 length:336 start_codon:yes stop_codon:yes gene_type:complete
MNIVKNKKLSIVTLLSAVCLSFSAWAISLDDAKNQGLVGEDSSGYLGLVVQNAEAKVVVDEINAKRKAQYLKLAKKNNLSLSQVEALAAAKTIEKTQSGHFVEVNGEWVKK